MARSRSHASPSKRRAASTSAVPRRTARPSSLRTSVPKPRRRRAPRRARATITSSVASAAAAAARAAVLGFQQGDATAAQAAVEVWQASRETSTSHGGNVAPCASTPQAPKARYPTVVASPTLPAKCQQRSTWSPPGYNTARGGGAEDAALQPQPRTSYDDAAAHKPKDSIHPTNPATCSPTVEEPVRARPARSSAHVRAAGDSGLGSPRVGRVELMRLSRQLRARGVHKSLAELMDVDSVALKDSPRSGRPDLGVRCQTEAGTTRVASPSTSPLATPCSPPASVPAAPAAAISNAATSPVAATDVPSPTTAASREPSAHDTDAGPEATRTASGAVVAALELPAVSRVTTTSHSGASSGNSKPTTPEAGRTTGTNADAVDNTKSSSQNQPASPPQCGQGEAPLTRVACGWEAGQGLDALRRARESAILADAHHDALANAQLAQLREEVSALASPEPAPDAPVVEQNTVPTVSAEPALATRGGGEAWWQSLGPTIVPVSNCAWTAGSDATLKALPTTPIRRSKSHSPSIEAAPSTSAAVKQPVARHQPRLRRPASASYAYAGGARRRTASNGAADTETVSIIGTWGGGSVAAQPCRLQHRQEVAVPEGWVAMTDPESGCRYVVADMVAAIMSVGTLP